MKKKILKYTDKLNKEFIRFLLTGALNTLFGLSISILVLKLLPISYILCMALSTSIGIIFNFISYQFLTYRVDFNIKRFPKFLLFHFIVYLINILLMGILISQGFDRVISLLYVFPFIILFTFKIQKNYIFKNEKN